MTKELSKHTMGPWKVKPFERPYALIGDTPLLGYQVIDADGTVICEMYPQPWPVHVNKDNASLIASAPELLDALAALVYIAETMVAELDLQSDPSALVHARAAIAKARGEETLAA